MIEHVSKRNRKNKIPNRGIRIRKTGSRGLLGSMVRLLPQACPCGGKAGKVTVAKADIDELPEIARQYEIDTIPTLILFQDGKEADRVVNPPSQDAVEEWLKTNQVI